MSAKEKQAREDKNAVFRDEQPVALSVTDPRANPLAELGIAIPAQTVPLPSGGRVYPATSPLHMRETVDVKAMTSQEEDIISSRALIKNGTVVSRLLQASLTDRAIDVGSMLSGDGNALLVAVRVTGYGAAYVSDVQCPKCSTQSELEVDLSALPIKELGIEPVEPGKNEFEVRVPVSGALVRFKFMTIADEESILRDEEAKKKRNIFVDSLVTARHLRSLVSVNGRTEPGLLAKFAQHMPAGDSAFLRRHVSENEPGIDMSADFECKNPECGEISRVEVRLGASFFWPDARKQS